MLYQKRSDLPGLLLQKEDKILVDNAASSALSSFTGEIAKKPICSILKFQFFENVYFEFQLENQGMIT
ncbi:hypothetical protein SCA6_017016 [Theobroma cacao]